MSWFVEVLTGVGVIVTWQLAEKRSIHIYRLFITIIGFVITPCTYVLNREATKKIILVENWWLGIRSAFMFEKELTLTAERLEQQVNGH